MQINPVRNLAFTSRPRSAAFENFPSLPTSFFGNIFDNSDIASNEMFNIWINLKTYHIMICVNEPENETKETLYKNVQMYVEKSSINSLHDILQKHKPQLSTPPPPSSDVLLWYMVVSTICNNVIVELNSRNIIGSHQNFSGHADTSLRTGSVRGDSCNISTSDVGKHRKFMNKTFDSNLKQFDELKSKVTHDMRFVLFSGEKNKLQFTYVKYLLCKFFSTKSTLFFKGKGMVDNEVQMWNQSMDRLRKDIISMIHNIFIPRSSNYLPDDILQDIYKRANMNYMFGTKMKFEEMKKYYDTLQHLNDTQKKNRLNEKLFKKYDENLQAQQSQKPQPLIRRIKSAPN